MFHRLLLVALLATGCSATAPAMPSALSKPAPAPYRQVFADTVTDLALMKHLDNRVFRGQADLDAFTGEVGFQPNDAFAGQFALDFSAEVGVLVALPQQADLGPKLQVEVRGTHDVTIVPQCILPPYGQMAGATVARPIAYLAFAHDIGTITFASPEDVAQGTGA